MSDLIDRQAAIALAKDISVQTKDGVWKHRCIDPDEIRELPSAQTEQRWIPVTERLPEEEERGEYLTTNMYHNVFCDYWSGSHFDRTEVVIAWQPLPEPYEEGNT